MNFKKTPMKFNLFNGLIMFEGTEKDLDFFVSRLPDMREKLIDVQRATNTEVKVHQVELMEAQAELNKKMNGQPIRRDPSSLQ